MRELGRASANDSTTHALVTHMARDPIQRADEYHILYWSVDLLQTPLRHRWKPALHDVGMRTTVALDMATACTFSSTIACKTNIPILHLQRLLFTSLQPKRKRNRRHERVLLIFAETRTSRLQAKPEEIGSGAKRYINPLRPRGATHRRQPGACHPSLEWEMSRGKPIEIS
jgi:hypothetical protein